MELVIDTNIVFSAIVEDSVNMWIEKLYSIYIFLKYLTISPRI